jgi:spermidine synthase
MTRVLARCAFFLSGVAGLTFEIVWMRYLGLAIGATTLAVATTTAAYMGGLALGSHLGGRFADRLRRPLSVYGAIEMGLAGVGLVIPYVCKWIPKVDELLFADLHSGSYRALIRFVVAVVVLIVPTTAMGMTLPVLARAVTVRIGRVGREVGALYALNIAGAMIGAALAGFWWIPRMGLLTTNLLAVFIDLGLGSVALIGGLLLARVQPAIVMDAPVLRVGSRPLVALLVVTGAAAMALQVLWTRGLGTALGPSTYAFSAIVCTYLAGLAFGGAIAALVADRIPAARLALAVVLVATGCFSLLGIAIIDDLPLLLQRVVLDPKLTIGGLFRSEFALAALAVLPATVGMGAIFPLTLSAVVGSDSRLGAAVGRAYAFNTVGNIFGSFAAVFVLLPLFGVEWGMRVAAMSYLVVAGLLTRKLEPTVQPRFRWSVLAAASLVLVALVAWPSWDVGQWTAGMFRMSMTRYYYPEGEFDAAELIFHEDGLSTTVTVEEDHGIRWIKVNGKIDGSSEGDMPTQVLSGVLPMVFHPEPRRVAVIGCGSGVTAGAALHANPESLTLVELERAVIEAAGFFEAVNGAPWNDPRVTVVEDDGRNFMMHRGPRYDVIISEPSNPWMTGASSLFTVEFFEIAARRLNEDGIFLQWLQIYELAPERIDSVLKTFQSVFPHVLVFTPQADSNDLLILGRPSPWRLDWSQLAERFDELSDQMSRADLQALEELVTLLLFTDEQIRAIDPTIPLNTDDNAYIEFGAPRDLLAYADDDPVVSPVERVRGRRPHLIEALIRVEKADWPRRLSTLARTYLQQGFIPDAVAAARQVASFDTSPQVREAALRVRRLARLLQEDDRERVIDGGLTGSDPQYAILAALVEQGDEEQALSQIEAVPELKGKSGAHALLYGFLLYRDGQYSAARRALLRAREHANIQQHTVIAYYLAKQSFEVGDYRRAVDEMAHYQETAIRRLSPVAPPE